MIGVIGCGNMANAIVRGYNSKKKNSDFITYDPNTENSQALAKAVDGKVAQSLSDLKEADTIIIACKPQHFNGLTEDLKSQDVDLKDKYIVSIMAATPMEKIQSMLECSRVSRVMPNTPIFLGEGMSLLLHSKDVTDKERTFLKDFFSSCGEVADIESEEAFNKITAVSGSGPAYVFLFAKTMMDKLLEWGVEEKSARLIVTQLFKGSSDLMKSQSDEGLQELIDKVTSKGGVTIEAVNTYNKHSLGKITSEALDNAEKRALEMIKEMN